MMIGDVVLCAYHVYLKLAKFDHFLVLQFYNKFEVYTIVYCRDMAKSNIIVNITVISVVNSGSYIALARLSQKAVESCQHIIEIYIFFDVSAQPLMYIIMYKPVKMCCSEPLDSYLEHPQPQVYH